MNLMLKVLFLIVMPVASFAWVPQMQFQVTPQYSQVQVINPMGYQAYCQGYVFGQTQNGMVMNSWFSSYLPAGGYAYAYVQAMPPYYFVNSWANIECQ